MKPVNNIGKTINQIMTKHNIVFTKMEKFTYESSNYYGQLGLGYVTTSSPYGVSSPTENSKPE